MIKWLEAVRHVVKDGEVHHEVEGFWLIANETFSPKHPMRLLADGRLRVGKTIYSQQ